MSETERLRGQVASLRTALEEAERGARFQYESSLIGGSGPAPTSHRDPRVQSVVIPVLEWQRLRWLARVQDASEEQA